MYTLVALDVDGTLLDSRHLLVPEVAQAVRAVRARGVHVCLATGKLYASVKDLIDTLGLDGPQITCNGAVVVDARSGAILHHWPLDAAELALSRATLAEYAPDLPVAWYTDQAIYSTSARGYLDDILASYHEPPVRHVASLDDLPSPVKLLMAGTPERFAALRAIIDPLLAGKIRVVRTAPEFLELMSLRTSKGVALQTVLDVLGMDRAASIAMGDSENDLPLLAVAGLRVAMGNAVPAVLASADLITAANDAAGVARALESLILHPEQRGSR